MSSGKTYDAGYVSASRVLSQFFIVFRILSILVYDLHVHVYIRLLLLIKYTVTGKV